MNASLSDFTEADLPACSARFLWAAVSLSDTHKIFDPCNVHPYFYINILVKEVRVIIEVLR